MPLKTLIFIIICNMVSFAQQLQGFSVLSLEGSANVQHSEQYVWNKVTTGDNVQTNDIFETGFQTRLQLQYQENSIVLGSNTKALIDFKTKGGSDSVRFELSVTVFNGGVLTRTQRGCRLQVFTANAVAETDSATLSTIADSKSGESGFQVIGGLVNIRNVVQSKGVILRSGLTTMVLPNKEPSASLYMTNRHVTVLKHFFGDEYVQVQLDQSGVKPTEEKSGNRLSFSKNYSSQSPAPVNDDMYKQLFNKEKIYGSIVEDQLNAYGFYHCYSPSPNVIKKKYRLTVGTEQGAGNDQSFSSYILSPAFGYRFIDIALRFAFNKEAQGHIGMDFSGSEALLDKIDHLTVGYKQNRSFIEIGQFDNITCGNGLVVDRFRNGSPGSIYHPAGVNAETYLLSALTMKGFLNDISNPNTGGLYLSYEPSSYYIGFGYYFDRDQHDVLVNEQNYRYAPPAANAVPVGAKNAPVHIAELNLGVDLALNYEFNARLFAEVAQKLSGGHDDGRVVRVPSLLIDFYKSHLGFNLFIETGRLFNRQFNSSYLLHRNFIYTDSIRGTTTRESVNSLFSKKRTALGASLQFGINPVKGIDLFAGYTQNIKELRTWIVATDTTDSCADASHLNYSFNLRLAINDSLIRFVKYAAVYFGQDNTSYFPRDAKPLMAWGAEAGIDLQTNPIIFNIALESRLRYFYLENTKTMNNYINNDDHIIEWYVGILWGFYND